MPIFKRDEKIEASRQGSCESAWAVPQREAQGKYVPCEIETLIGGADMRVKVTMACTECKQRNYNTKKNKKNDPDRLEMNKYCKFCKKHTLHKETK